MKSGKPIINVRGLECRPEVEEKFNKWYNEVHIPMLLKAGLIKEATRFKRIGDDEKYPKYLAIYRFEDQQAFERYKKAKAPAAAMEEMKQTWGDNGPQNKWGVQYEVIKTWSQQEIARYKPE